MGEGAIFLLIDSSSCSTLLQNWQNKFHPTRFQSAVHHCKYSTTSSQYSLNFKSYFKSITLHYDQGKLLESFDLLTFTVAPVCNFQLRVFAFCSLKLTPRQKCSSIRCTKGFLRRTCTIQAAFSVFVLVHS